MSEIENLLKAVQARSAEKSTPYLPSLTDTSYDIEDADTIDGQRILGFDAPESVDLYREGGKAQRIEEDYGVNRKLQELLGKRATTRTYRRTDARSHLSTIRCSTRYRCVW